MVIIMINPKTGGLEVDIEEVNRLFESWYRKLNSNTKHPYLRECNDVNADRRYQQQDTQFAWECFLSGYENAVRHQLKEKP